MRDGGRQALLKRLAKTYLGPDVDYPALDEVNDGWVTRITPQRIRGWGPWQEANPM